MSSKPKEKDIINELVGNSRWNELKQRFCTDIDKYVSIVKKEGFLRASKYDYDIEKPKAVLCCLLNVNIFVDLKIIEKQINNSQSKHKDYFTSCLKLYSIAPRIKESFEYVKTRNKKYDYASLVYVNTSFTNPNMKTESLADGLSCAIACSQSFDVDGFFMASKQINMCFDETSKIIEYRNLEILVDCFNVYVDEKGFDKKKNLRYFELRDEKKYLYSIQWGWKRAFLQQCSQEVSSSNSGVHLENIVNKFIDNYDLMKLIKIEDSFVVLNVRWSHEKRIRTALTDLKMIVSRQGIYGDEAFISKVIGTELLLPMEYYDKKFIHKAYSVWDVIIFRRLLILLSLLVRRSTPSFQSYYFCLRVNRNSFKKFLRTFIEHNTDLVLNDNVQVGYSGFVDIRYSSIIQYGESYIIPTEIMVKNNMLRNIMSKYGEQARVDGAGEVDLIHEKYVESLKKMNIPCCGHVIYEESDLDTIFEIDDVIFISENKNMLFPTSYHEARNIVYHYEKAKLQRDVFMALFKKQDKELFKILDGLKKDGIDFRNAKEVVFYLTFGNRNVYQLNSLDFPVTYINQITSFIENEPIKIHRLGKEGDSVVDGKKWRTNSKLTANDMKKYLEWDKNLPDIKQVQSQIKMGKNIFKFPNAEIVWQKKEGC